MKRITIIMMLLSIFSKFFGFARELVLSNTYGAGAISDAFVFSYNLPSTLFSVIIAAFVTGFIPMYTRIRKDDGSEEANKFVNNIQNVMLLIAIILGVFYLLFTDAFLAVMTPKATPELLMYLRPFSRITIFTLIFTCTIQILTGFLQIHEAFIFPVALAFPLNIILIGSILLSKSVSPILLPIGILLAYAVQAALIMWYAGKKGYRFKLYINLKDPNLKIMLTLAIPLIVGSATSSIGGLVNQALASSVVGGISHIGYAQKIGGMVEGIFGLAIVSVMYPALSKAVSVKDYDKAADEYENAMSSLLLFIVPCAVGMSVLATPIVQFVYMRGEFGPEAAAVLAQVFRTYSMGLVSYSMYGLLARVFYSFQDTKTPMYVSVANITLQIILGYTFMKLMGLHGITLGMAVASTFGMLLLFFLSLKKFDNFNLKEFLIEFTKIVGSSLIMGGVAFVLFRLLNGHTSSNIAILGTIFVAVAVYLFLIVIFRVKVLVELMDSIKNRK